MTSIGPFDADAVCQQLRENEEFERNYCGFYTMTEQELTNLWLAYNNAIEDDSVPNNVQVELFFGDDDESDDLVPMDVED